MTKKWRVEKDGDEWAVITHRRRIHKWYETHTEAISEAQKLARRVVVKLPAGEDMEHAGGYRIWSRNHSARVSNGFEGIAISPDEIKPLSLALLAHHYKNQKEHQ